MGSTRRVHPVACAGIQASRRTHAASYADELGQGRAGHSAPSNERAHARVAGNEPAISMLPFVGKCVIALALLALNRLAFDHKHKQGADHVESQC